jgi:hypothetical protein
MQNRLTRALRFTMLVGIIAASLSAQTVAADDVLSIDDGRQVMPIARVVDGRWVAEKCTSRERFAASADQMRVRVSGDLQLAPVRAIASGSPEWLRLMPTIIELFARREREERVSDRTANGPRAVDWIYASDSGDRRVYYFEASRRVSNVTPDVDHDTDPPGTLRIAVAGFLGESGATLTPLGTKSELRWEQDGQPAGPNRADLTPLGIIGQGTRSVWVMKGHAGTSVWFALYEVTGAGMRTLLTTRLAGC